MKKIFYSNGKLLLSGEYLVLDGAMALALPTKFGQSLEVSPILEPKIIWKSYDVNKNIWLAVTINLNEVVSPSNNKVSNDIEETKTLISILQETQKLNPHFLNNNSGFAINTYLDFPRDWGLGSSSTLINNIASWANVDAFTLLKRTFGGSGYDIAAAQHNKPILYRKTKKGQEVKPISLLNWQFTNQLFFVHLNKKQNSRTGIANYSIQKKKKQVPISEITDYTLKMVNCSTIKTFENLLSQHEQCIASVINQPTIKELLFKDYPREIKSLGAWGGDFILATGGKDNWDYFIEKGYKTILSFQDMILTSNSPV